MIPFLERLIGPNWRTTLGGAVTMISAYIVANPDLLNAVLAPEHARRVFSVAALFSGLVTFAHAKDAQVTGGTVNQPTPIFRRQAGEDDDKPRGL